MTKDNSFPEAAFESCFDSRRTLIKEANGLLGILKKMKKEAVVKFKKEQEIEPDVVYLVFLQTSRNVYEGDCLFYNEITGEGQEKEERKSLWRFNGGKFMEKQDYQLIEFNGNGDKTPWKLGLELARGRKKYKAELLTFIDKCETHAIDVYKGEMKLGKKSINTEVTVIRLPVKVEPTLDLNIATDECRSFIGLVETLINSGRK